MTYQYEEHRTACTTRHPTRTCQLKSKINNVNQGLYRGKHQLIHLVQRITRTAQMQINTENTAKSFEKYETVKMKNTARIISFLRQRPEIKLTNPHWSHLHPIKIIHQWHQLENRIATITIESPFHRQPQSLHSGGTRLCLSQTFPLAAGQSLYCISFSRLWPGNIFCSTIWKILCTNLRFRIWSWHRS